MKIDNFINNKLIISLDEDLMMGDGQLRIGNGCGT